jgi:hypothetical protein
MTTSARADILADATEAVLDTEEQMGRTRDPNIVWAFPTEIPNGTWGAAGQIVRLGDIAALVLGSRRKATPTLNKCWQPATQSNPHPPDPSQAELPLSKVVWIATHTRRVKRRAKK